MTETERIGDELRRALDGDPWHGSSVRAILDGVTAEQAAARPVPGAHGIWELVLHMTSWARETARRLREGVAREPEDGDWPAVGDTGERAWAGALEGLARAHAEVHAAVAALGDERMDEIVGDERDRPLGSGVSYYVLLHGLAQHDAYHAGQVALLKKALGA